MVWNPLSSMRRFTADVGGNFVIMFALGAPVVILAMAAALSYSNTVMTQERTQAAADAAALAATSAFASGNVTTTTAAQAIAQQYFQSNAPQDALTGQISFNAVTSASTGAGAGTVSTTVSYSGQISNLASSLIGGSMSKFSAAATTTAAIANQQSAGGTFSGGSDSWGDPHIIGQDGANFYIACPQGGWSNVLSDYGVEINGTCNPYYDGAYFINDIAMVLGGHQIYLLAPDALTPDGQATSANYANATTWSGYVQVDGIVTNPTVAGNYVVLNDTAQKITVTDYVGAPGVGMSYANYLIVTTPEYTVTIDYADLGAANIQVYATNAGVCQTPGGFLGQTYGPTSAVDMTWQDFVVPSAYSTTAQYSNACADVAKIVSTNTTTITK